MNCTADGRLSSGYPAICTSLAESFFHAMSDSIRILLYSPCNARRSDPADSPLAGNTPAPLSSNTPPVFPSIFL